MQTSARQKIILSEKINQKYAINYFLIKYG